MKIKKLEYLGVGMDETTLVKVISDEGTGVLAVWLNEYDDLDGCWFSIERDVNGEEPFLGLSWIWNYEGRVRNYIKRK